MGKVLGTICIALGALITPGAAQQDSVSVTTYVRCPQTAVLDSLNAFQAAAARRDSALRVFFSENIPVCPVAPDQIPSEETFLDRVAFWAPLVLSAVTLIAVLTTKNDTKVIRETVIIHKPDDDR